MSGNVPQNTIGRSSIRAVLKQTVEDIFGKDITLPHYTVEPPPNPEQGDYASNIAFGLSKELKMSPREIATRVSDAFSAHGEIMAQFDRIEVAGSGFINFFMKNKYYYSSINRFIKTDLNTISLYGGAIPHTVVEFAHPNTLKLFHIGHLRNTITGEALARIFEACGHKVTRINYQGDIGMHISKTLWRIERRIAEGGDTSLEKLRSLTLREKISFIGKAYAEANGAFESDETAKSEIIDMNRRIYTKEEAAHNLWKETREWSLEYFEGMYRMVGTRFDKLYFESDMAERGVELSREAVTKGILKEDAGAIIFDGTPYGLDTRVFINSQGFPTYEGKEIALAEQEWKDLAPADRIYHLVTKEQSSFFSVTFKVQELMELIPPGVQYHLTYGWVDVKGQKMSSRKGNIIEGEWLIQEATRQLKAEHADLSDETAGKLAIAAVKYTFLKTGLQNKVLFDAGEAVSLSGNSGPYLLYTLVRAGSVLSKASEAGIAVPDQFEQPDNTYNNNSAEAALLRLLPRYTEVIEDAHRIVSPHVIAEYLYNLAGAYNNMYGSCPIIQAEAPEQNHRIVLTLAVKRVLEAGLNLLGIETVEKM